MEGREEESRCWLRGMKPGPRSSGSTIATLGRPMNGETIFTRSLGCCFPRDLGLDNIPHNPASTTESRDTHTHKERERGRQRDMDSIEQQKRQAMAEFRKAESSRSALRSLFSIILLFLFCLLVSLPSWDLYLPLFLTSLPDCFWVDRKAMFLLCNLILIVIAMDSGLLASFVPERDLRDEFSVREKGHRRTEEVGLVASSGSALQVPTMEKGNKPEEEEEGEEEEEQQEEEEEDGYPDMDELNKKFEDFIEKVKMERKLEALQLVLV